MCCYALEMRGSRIDVELDQNPFLAMKLSVAAGSSSQG